MRFSALTTAAVVASASTAASTPLQAAPVVEGNAPGLQFIAILPRNKVGVEGAFVVSSAPDGKGANIQASVSGLPVNGEQYTYHIHEKPVPSDGNCTGTGDHLDPYLVKDDPCNPDQPQLCQVGDLSGKHGKASPPNFSQNYVDRYLAMSPGSPAFFGNLSIVVHFANKTRITCANFTSNDATPPNDGAPANAAGTTTVVALAAIPTTATVWPSVVQVTSTTQGNAPPPITVTIHPTATVTVFQSGPVTITSTQAMPTTSTMTATPSTITQVKTEQPGQSTITVTGTISTVTVIMSANPSTLWSISISPSTPSNATMTASLAAPAGPTIVNCPAMTEPRTIMLFVPSGAVPTVTVTYSAGRLLTPSTTTTTPSTTQSTQAVSSPSPQIIVVPVAVIVPTPPGQTITQISTLIAPITVTMPAPGLPLPVTNLLSAPAPVTVTLPASLAPTQPIVSLVNTVLGAPQILPPVVGVTSILSPAVGVTSILSPALKVTSILDVPNVIPTLTLPSLPLVPTQLPLTIPPLLGDSSDETTTSTPSSTASTTTSSVSISTSTPTALVASASGAKASYSTSGTLAGMVIGVVVLMVGL